MRTNTKAVCVLLAVCGTLALPAMAQDCGWDGLDATISAGGEAKLEMVVYDNGAGPALYVAAGSLTAGLERLGDIARFDGDKWSAVGEPGGVWVSAMDTLDLGNGPRLYAAFSDFFSSRIHLLDGDAWVPYGPTLDGSATSIVAFDDGSGPMLYAAGNIDFTFDGARARGVARLEDGQWKGFGGIGGSWVGVLGSVHDLAVFDDGDGPALYIAGDNIRPNIVPSETGLTRWNGTEFSVVEGLVYPFLRDLLVFDNGNGEALYLGGRMNFPSGQHDVGVARWDGDAMVALGSEFEDEVHSLAGFDSGAGQTLYAAGPFEHIGPRRIEYLARWDGVAWRPLEEALDHRVSTIAASDDDDLYGLYALGGFTHAGGAYVGNVARWDGCDACPADLDVDGELTVFDFLAFQNLFDAGRPEADFDGDGELTLLDFLAFQNAFDAGCA